MQATPTAADRQLGRRDFSTVAEALDDAALQETGINIHSLRGELVEAIPYRVLREQAIGLARRMLGSGLVPGQRVALAATTDGDFVRAFFACQYAGLVPAPLPLPAPLGGKDAYIAHLQRMMASAKPSAAFAPEELTSWFTAAGEGLGLQRVCTVNDLPEAGEVELPTPDPDGLCYLQFSSGSTRFPLGVAVTQRALIANALATAYDGGQATPRDRAVSWLPLYHDMGLVGFLLMPVVAQMSVDLLPTAAFVRRPLLWLELISRNGGTFSYSPTFGYELASRRAEAATLDGVDLSGWRIAGLGGDMIRARPLRQFADTVAKAGFDARAFTASYGMAEATLGLTMAPLNIGLRTDEVDVDRLEREGVAALPGPNVRSREFALCGHVLPRHDVEIRAEDGSILSDRRVGRIFARGPSLMTAYFDQPEETDRILSADGWLDTGDLGYTIEGEIVITGRAKDLIIVNGRNIWPQDLEWTVEAAIANLRSGDAAVFSVPGEDEEAVVALVQCRSSNPEVRDDLRKEVHGLLQVRHGLDVDVVLVPPHSLPQTSSGKLSRSRAKAMYQAGVFSTPPTAALSA